MIKTYALSGMAAGLCIAAGTSSAADAPWIQPTGNPVQINAADAEINGLAASSDGHRLYVDSDASLFTVDSTTFKPLDAPIREHLSTSGLAVPLSGGSRLLMATWVEGSGKPKGELALSDWQSKKRQKIAALSKEPHLVAPSSDGARAAVAYTDDTIQVFDGASGKSLFGPAKVIPATVVMGEHIDKVTALALSPDGSRLAVASQDTSVRIVDAASGQHPVVLDAGAFHGVSFAHAGAKQLIFTPDGKRVLAFEQGNNLAVYDAATGKPLGASVQIRTQVAALALTPDGKRLIIASTDGQLQSWAL